MLSVRSVVIVCLLLSSMLAAQESHPSDAETIALLVQQVTALQQQTSDLRARVKMLEGNQPVVATSSSENTTPGLDDTQANSVAAAEARVNLDSLLHNLHGFQWRGFGEVNYKVLDQRQPELGAYGFVPGSAGGFYTGDFDLLLTSRISERASVLSETVLGEGDAQSFGVDLERVLLKYDYNDHLRM